MKLKIKLKKIIFLFMLISIFEYLMPKIETPRLLIKIPTRSRPTQFFNILDKYYNNLSNQITYKFLITCDEDDKSMNNSQVISKLKKYKNLHFYFGRNKSKIEAYNKDIDKHLDFDILLVASDDAYPIIKGYDKIIADIMLKNFPDFDGVLHFSDGYRKNLNTLPILGKKYYKRFNYIYHPDYKSVYCDNELTLISKMLNKEFYSKKILIKHEHPANDRKIAYDALYKKNDQYYPYDYAIFKSRYKNNFFLN